MDEVYDPVTGAQISPGGFDPAQAQRIAASLRKPVEWAKGQFSLDKQPEQGVGADLADAALGFVPYVGQAMAARDIERARRDNDPAGMALAGASMLPVARLGKALKGVKNELFGGEKALSHKNLDVAKKAEELGQDSWDTAGWFRGKENHAPWKFEIDDSKAKLKNLTELHNGEGEYVGKMKDFLDHPELYKNYPDAGELFITARRQKSIKPGEGEGSYYHSSKGIDAGAHDDAELRNTLLHEVQHHIQMQEGFNPGANGQAIAKALRDARVKQGTVPATTDPDLTWRLYNRNMGEVESRAVEARSLWGPEQRQSTHPLSHMGPEGSLYDHDRTVKSIVQHTAPKKPKKFDSELYDSISDTIE
jgi:hypothetical protein